MEAIESRAFAQGNAGVNCETQASRIAKGVFATHVAAEKIA
jgi:hypothetical protein